MDENNDTELIADTEEVVDTETESTTEESETAQPKVEKPKRTPQEELAHLEGRVKRLKKDLGVEVEPTKEDKPAPKTGELDENALDYLDLKGVIESEDIKLIEDIVKKTGMSVRNALKDDYVLAKLDANKKARDVSAATPSSTRRASQAASDNEDFWFAKYESEGRLPQGLPQGMAEKLVNRKLSSEDPSRNPYE